MPPRPKPPFIPGHEGVGYVSAVGAGVKHVKEGDRVGVPWLYTACGHCRHCLGGWETLCEAAEHRLFGERRLRRIRRGGSELRRPPARQTSFVEIAPILCAGVTVYKGLKVTDTKPGDWVVVSGIGGLGHMAVQYARAMGLNVAVVRRRRQARARQAARALAVERHDADPVAFVKKEIGGAQGVLVTAVSPKAFEQALGMVAAAERCRCRPAARLFPAPHLRHGARCGARI